MTNAKEQAVLISKHVLRAMAINILNVQSAMGRGLLHVQAVKVLGKCESYYLFNALQQSNTPIRGVALL